MSHAAPPSWPPQPPTAGSDVPLALQTMLSQQAAILTDVSALRADVSRALTRIEVIDARNTGADKDHGDYEARLRVLEQFRWTWLGVSLVGGFLSGFIGYLVGHAVH